MKQVKFGSFPLAEILPKERECLDKYLIKHFADSISFKDTLTNLAITKNTFYVGPSEIIRGMMSNQPSGFSIKDDNTDGAGDRRNQRVDAQSYDNNSDTRNYLEVQKRAFSVMSKFYTELTNSAFYKGLMYYPIYVEKLEKTMRGGRNNVTGLEQRFNYSFLLLTNDLLPGTNRPVNEAGVINFLYMYLHLFHSPFLLNDNLGYSVTPGTGLASMNKENVILVMRFYKLIQKYDLNPITVFLSIYKLIAEAKTFINENDDGKTNLNKANFGTSLQTRLIKNLDKYNGKHFKNILENVINKMVKLFELQTGSGKTNKESIANANIMIEIVKLMLDERQIFDFVDDLNDRRHSKDARIQAVSDYHHYQEIIGLFEALVSFNEMTIMDIIKDTSMNFGTALKLDNSLQDEEDRMAGLVGAIDRGDFDTAFNKFYRDLHTYIVNTTGNIIKPKLEKAEKAKTARVDNQQAEFENRIENTQINIDNTKLELLHIQAEVSHYEDLVPTQPDLQPTLDSKNSEKLALNNTIQSLEAQLTQTIADKAIFLNNFPREDKDKDKKKDVVNYLANSIFNNIDDALGFIYKDLENLFINPMVLDQLINVEDFKDIPDSEISLDGILKSNPAMDWGNQSDDLVKAAYSQLHEDINFLVKTIVNEFENHTEESGKQLEDNIKANVIKGLGLRFFGIMKKHLRNRESKLEKVLAYDAQMQGIHPLIGKMSRKTNNFKTFILSTNVLSTLYNLIFITQERMFLAGLIKRPPRKINSSDLQSRFIINNILGLQSNPTWIIGENKIRLNLPDYLSLTGSPVQSEVPQNKLKGLCKVDYKEFSWKDGPMGNLLPDGEPGPQVKKAQEARDAVEKKLKPLRTKKPEDLSNSQKAEKIKLAEELVELDSKLLEARLKFGNSDFSMGNMGKILSKDNYDDFKLQTGFKDEAEYSSEEYDDLSDEAKEGVIDPKAKTLDHNMGLGYNKDLKYLQGTPAIPTSTPVQPVQPVAPPVGTTQLGNYGDDIRTQMWTDKIRGRQAN